MSIANQKSKISCWLFAAGGMPVLICIINLALLSAGIVSARAEEATFEVTVNKIMMGTTVETTARDSNLSHCKQALYLAYREIERVDNLLTCNNNNPGSEIVRINAAAGDHPVTVSPETFAIIGRAKSYGPQLEGLFDISIGSLTALWGFSDDAGPKGVPSQEEIDRNRKLVDYRAIRLDSLRCTVFLPARGSGLDLGGIAKGYAIDRAAFILRQQGIRDFIVNAGGDLYVSGKKDEQTEWRVGIQDPRIPDSLTASFNLRDYAVATSGDYERFEIIDGRRYHHIIDPRTGYPGILSQSSSAFAKTAEEADVMATYLFVLGYQETVSGKKPDFPFLIIASDGSLHFNDAFSRLDGIEVFGAGQGRNQNKSP